MTPTTMESAPERGRVSADPLAQSVDAFFREHPEAAHALLLALRREDSTREVLNLKCNVDIQLIGPEGEVKEERHLHNLITTAGKTALTLTSASSKYLKDFTYMAIGSGATAANAADTTLQTEVARVAVTQSNPATNSIKYSASFGAGTGTGNVQEYGLLSAASVGTLLNHLVDGSATPKGASDTLTVDITISL